MSIYITIFVEMCKYLVYASGFVIIGYCFNKYYKTKKLSIMDESKVPISELFQFKTQCETKKPIPIVYNTNYDISFWNLESWHPFDTHKWKRVNDKLNFFFKSNNKDYTIISPLRSINNEELSIIHSKEFLEKIHTSKRVIANAAEVYLLAYLPLYFIKQNLLTPLKWQTAGSILAAYQALNNKWAINIGGGFHHASAESAGGFCIFADISLIMKILWNTYDDKLKIMIIDLDAHQGNGYARDIFGFPRYLQQQVYVLDIFNADIYPNDNFAKPIINKRVEIHSHIKDEEYLNLLEIKMKESFNEFQPDLIVYNAGTDILLGDPLGKLDISEEGIKNRDEMVFKAALEKNIPIVMLTSGGYQHSNAGLISNSIINLFNKGLIFSN